MCNVNAFNVLFNNKCNEHSFITVAVPNCIGTDCSFICNMILCLCRNSNILHLFWLIYFSSCFNHENDEFCDEKNRTE